MTHTSRVYQTEAKSPQIEFEFKRANFKQSLQDCKPQAQHHSISILIDSALLEYRHQSDDRNHNSLTPPWLKCEIANVGIQTRTGAQELLMPATNSYTLIISDTPKLCNDEHTISDVLMSALVLPPHSKAIRRKDLANSVFLFFPVLTVPGHVIDPQRFQANTFISLSEHSKIREFFAELLSNHSPRNFSGSPYLSERNLATTQDYVATRTHLASVHLQNGLPIGEVAKLGAIAARTLQNNFRKIYGYTAKTWQKINRFQRIQTGIASSIKEKRELKLSNFAESYTDQSHMNHDFLEMCGLPPRAFSSEIAKII